MAVTEEQKNWVELLKTHAERIGILAGFKDLQALHGEWIRKMLFCKDMYVLKAHRGSFKCLNPDTMVMMSDYSSKAIKDIEVGEYVMGWDGTPRKVIHKHSGRSPMYRVTLNKNGEYYECNNNHILTLRQRPIKHNKFHCVDEYRFEGDKNIINIPIEDFLKSPANKTNGKKSRETFFKHFKVGLNNIPERQVEIPPYILGLWLGDGHSHNVSITMADTDQVCIDEFRKYCLSFGGVEHIYRKPNAKCATYVYSRAGIKQLFRKYNLINNKHIPDDYLYNSRENRLQLLAGLLDTDGHYDRCYVFATSRENLAKQVEWLARSLGFNAKATRYKSWWTYNGEKKENFAWQVYINGDLTQIPVKLERRKAKQKQNNKCHLSFSQTIESIGEGNFVGIAVEGDGMFLLDNFLVVHNTSVLEIVIALFIVLKPNCSIFFVRKTDDDVKEVVEKVQHLLKKDVFRVLTKVMHGVDLVLEKETAFAIDTNLNQHKEMVTAQLLGFGLKGSMTGKHCDILILDDICFVAGTKIATPFGDKNIEDLRVGDLVLTSTGYERIVKTTNRIADVITNVGLCGTPNHPVYSKATRDYKPLAEVTADEIVRLNDKQYECQSFSGKQTVYNIEVEHAHNYYANGILVHNCNTKDRESFAERELTKRVYFELNNNIKKKGGITIVTGTTWHVDDVFSVMPPAEIKTCYETGLLTEEQIQQLKDTMPPDLFAANYELRFVASGDCLFTTPKYTDDETLIYDGICHVDAGYGGNDYTAFCIVKKVPDEEKFIAFGKLWHRHVNDCIPEIENLIKKYRCGTLYLETNGDKGYLAKEFRHRKIRCVTYHERMNKHAKISTYLYKAWKNMVWLKSTDEKYIGQILDYTEMADHDDALECANLLRVLDRGKVQTIKGINL